MAGNPEPLNPIRAALRQGTCLVRLSLSLAGTVVLSVVVNAVVSQNPEDTLRCGRARSWCGRA